MTPFLYHIAVIIGFCSEEKMIGIYTRRIVALVENEKTQRDVPNIQTV